MTAFKSVQLFNAQHVNFQFTASQRVGRRDSQQAQPPDAIGLAIQLFHEFRIDQYHWTYVVRARCAFWSPTDIPQHVASLKRHQLLRLRVISGKLHLRYKRRMRGANEEHRDIEHGETHNGHKHDARNEKVDYYTAGADVCNTRAINRVSNTGAVGCVDHNNNNNSDDADDIRADNRREDNHRNREHYMDKFSRN